MLWICMWAKGYIKYYGSYLDRLCMTLECCFTANSFAETFALCLHIKGDFIKRPCRRESIFSLSFLCAIVKKTPDLSRFDSVLQNVAAGVFGVCLDLGRRNVLVSVEKAQSVYSGVSEACRTFRAGPEEERQSAQTRWISRFFRCLHASLTSEWPESVLSLFC